MTTKQQYQFLVLAGYAPSLVGFRGPLIDALLAQGLQVHAAAPGLYPSSAEGQVLTAKGVVVHSIAMQRTGQNPATDLRTLWGLWRLMREIRPHYVLGYTIKPVIYGSLAAWLARVPRRFALVTGLGYAFQGDEGRGRLRALVQKLYAVALGRVQVVFFQNSDNQQLFVQRGLLAPGIASVVVNGSGVEVDRFGPQPLPTDGPHFLLIARLLGDKGVREYAAAARLVRARHPQTRFALVGWIDENPDAIAQTELDAWVADGSLDYLGRLADVRPAIAACSVYVLPSYHEGTPRTVLEAMAMGRPIITTDIPGCRETVVDGDNGFLVPARNVNALATAILQFVYSPELVPQMGARSRAMAEDKYDVHKVNAVMLEAMGISDDPL